MTPLRAHELVLLEACSGVGPRAGLYPTCALSIAGGSAQSTLGKGVWVQHVPQECTSRSCKAKKGVEGRSRGERKQLPHV